jgi:hypothetical protein
MSTSNEPSPYTADNPGPARPGQKRPKPDYSSPYGNTTSRQLGRYRMGKKRGNRHTVATEANQPKPPWCPVWWENPPGPTGSTVEASIQAVREARACAARRKLPISGVSLSKPIHPRGGYTPKKTEGDPKAAFRSGKIYQCFGLNGGPQI